jgi:hypothetical protein
MNSESKPNWWHTERLPMGNRREPRTLQTHTTRGNDYERAMVAVRRQPYR